MRKGDRIWVSMDEKTWYPATFDHQKECLFENGIRKMVFFVRSEIEYPYSFAEPWNNGINPSEKGIHASMVDGSVSIVANGVSYLGDGVGRDEAYNSEIMKLCRKVAKSLQALAKELK